MTETDLIIIGGILVTLLLFIVARVGMEIYSKKPNLYKLTDVMVYGGAICGGLTALFTIVMMFAYWA